MQNDGGDTVACKVPVGGSPREYRIRDFTLELKPDESAVFDIDVNPPLDSDVVCMQLQLSLVCLDAKRIHSNPIGLAAGPFVYRVEAITVDGVAMVRFEHEVRA